MLDSLKNGGTQMKKRLVLPLLTALLLGLLCGTVAAADAAEGGSEVYDGQLRLENGIDRKSVV